MKQLLLLLFIFTNVQQPIFSQTIIQIPKAVNVTRESVKVNETLNSTFGGNSRALIEVPFPQVRRNGI